MNLGRSGLYIFKAKTKISLFRSMMKLLILVEVLFHQIYFEHENENFARCLKMELWSVITLRYDNFPSVFEMMKDEIDNRLSKGLTIWLVAGIWTSKVIADFLAVAVLILNKCFEREFMVSGMKQMSGDHTAENVKVVLAGIINDYEFNKRLSKWNFFMKQIYKIINGLEEVHLINDLNFTISDHFTGGNSI